jgi:hypothetical protein
MESSIGFPITIGSAIILSAIFFWYTYRHQREPLNGRGTEDSLNAEIAAQIQREIYLTISQDMAATKEAEAIEAEAEAIEAEAIEAEAIEAEEAEAIKEVLIL